MDDAEIEALVRRGLRSPGYMRQLIGALHENYSEAVKEGDGVRIEMFMAGLVLAREALKKVTK